MRTSSWLIGSIVLMTVPALAQVDPPDSINFQGVLRGAEGEPLDGPHDMYFHFWSEPELGHEIGMDPHTPVIVSGGLFNVALGGAFVDGPGPGVYSTLAEVFRDYPQVFIEIEIGVEVLAPRVQILAAAYASNTNFLDGRDSPFFVNISEQAQLKQGELTCEVPEAMAHLAWPMVSGDDILGHGIHAAGNYAGGLFESTIASGRAEVGTGDTGIRAEGDYVGGEFMDSDGSGLAYLGFGDRGIEAYGNGAAAYLANSSGNGYAYIGQTDFGIRAHGTGGGGYFQDLNATGQAWVGDADYGIHASGSVAGGWFQEDGGTGVAWVGYNGYGIYATGSAAGGWFDTVKVDDRLETGVLEIKGGSDVAEPFPVRSHGEIPEGAVVVIDESTTGGLAVSSVPYDPRVAGVVTGAGGIRPGITLSRGPVDEDEELVALAGRVFSLATTENGSIRPGDLLTTSSLPGHAMRATDREASFGATLGKAMSSLEEGTGLVLVLVNLQ
jgi:hypothetical protein